MADPGGNNSHLSAGAVFSTAFPAVGIAAGALDSNGADMVPLNLDASGNLKIAGNFTATLGGTTAVNITQVGGTAITLGQSVMATSFPVVIASDQTPIAVTGSFSATNPAVGTTGATAPTSADFVGVNVAGNLQGWSGVAAVNATAYAGRVDFSSVGGAVVSLGQAIMASSIPVVIASNQSAIPVTGSISASNPAVGTTGSAVPASADFLGLNVAGNLQGWSGLAVVNATAYSGRVDLSSMNGTALSIGQQVMTASIPVVLASNQSNVTTVIGAALPSGTNAIGTVSITQALPAGTNALGTVSALQSGNWSVLNLAGTAAIGTVSAIQIGTWAQNLTQINGTTLNIGQQVMTASIPVVIASNQSNVTTVLGAALPAGTNAIGTVSITQALPAGTNALGTVSITQALPAGTNALGTVSAIQSGTWSVLNLAGTAAIGTVSVTGALPAGTNALGTVSSIQSGSFTTIVSAAATANMTTATVTSSTTGAVTLLAALATGTSIYVGSIQFSNSGTVASVVTLSDISAAKFLVAGGAVNNAIFGVPLKTNAHSALTMTLSAVSTSVLCNVQGWGGP